MHPAPDLVSSLAAEASALEEVRRRAVILYLAVRAGEQRYVPAASAELDEAIDDLAAASLVRAVAVEESAGAFGLSPDATLRDLEAQCPDCRGEQVRELAERLRSAAVELAEVRAATAAVVEESQAQVHAALSRLEMPADYTAPGRRYASSSPGPSPALFDGRL